MTIDFVALRRDEFPIAATTAYLDNAGRGPLPQSHVAASTAFLRDMSERMSPADSAVLLDATRERAARLLNCGAEDIALLATTSQGLNIVPGGLDWRPGDEVVLYEMDHPTDIYTWLNLADRGVTVRFIKDRGGRYDPEDVESLIGPRTRAVCLSLVNYGTGFRAPVEEVGRICRRRGVWFVVDAIMALGALQMDAQAIGADIISAHGYKLLLSGFGSAICYCSPRARSELRVGEVGYKGMEHVRSYGEVQPDFSAMAGQPLGFATSARKFEAGTQALAMVAGMQATLDLLLTVGPDAIERRVMMLAGRLVEGLRARGYQVAGSSRQGERSSLVSFGREGVDVGELSRRLAERRIGHHVIHRRIRLSPHFYNDASDVEAALAAL